ncbi:MAG: DEAD/DEAH box helicase [Pseudomonadota bacterium]
MDFELLGLSEELLRAVAEAGYTVPTPIQRQAIPVVLMGRDVLGIAQTGTGKTAGFTLPMIDVLAQGRARARMPRSLILEPTRELAAQVAESFQKYGKYHKLTMALLIGGVSFGDQEAALDKGADVLIATPGRLLDHFERGRILLSGVDILVIDEADRMLDMGFIPDVERICALMPQKHQTLFFSATMPPPVKRLADRFLDEPKVIEVAPPASTAETVTLYQVPVAIRDKRKVLRQLLRRDQETTAIIFCNRKRDVRVLHESLVRHGFSAVQLQGDMDQPVRMDMLARFRKGEARILVASDVAARGLDIPTVSHVYNFDVPVNPEDYVHRIGRTGRAGRSGEAVTLVAPSEKDAMAAIEKLIGKRPERLEIEGAPPAAPEPAGEKARPQKRRAKGAGDKARAPQSRKSQGAGPARQTRPRTKDKDRAQDDTKPVVGMGDHMPAFLVRPVPKR